MTYTPSIPVRLPKIPIINISINAQVVFIFFLVTSQYINPVNNNGNRHGTIPFITSAITTLVSPFVYVNGYSP